MVQMSGQNRGGYAPQFSASIYNGKLSIGGMPAIDKEKTRLSGMLDIQKKSWMVL